jgi:hypothetical protein
MARAVAMLDCSIDGSWRFWTLLQVSFECHDERLALQLVNAHHDWP